MASSRTTNSAQSSRSVVKIKTAAAIKLDESNFFSWKTQVLANLRGYELLHYVEAPVDKSDPAAVQQGQFLIGWIFSALSPSILSQVVAYTTSYEVWSALQHLINAKSRSRKLQLRHELSIFKKGGLTTDQYLAAISRKVDEVRDAIDTMKIGIRLPHLMIVVPDSRTGLFSNLQVRTRPGMRTPSALTTPQMTRQIYQIRTPR